VNKLSNSQTKDMSSAVFKVMGAIIIFCIINAVSLNAQPPPNYETFNRTQKISHDFEVDDLMRIWIVNVGQGDGVIIQMPEKYNYYMGDEYDENSQRVDILIDGGSNDANNAELIGKFINKLYPESDPIIEHTVITHHDRDHILGIIDIAADTNIMLKKFYHNGLATYKPGIHDFPTTYSSNLNAVVSYNSTTKAISRCMAFYDDDGKLYDRNLIQNLSQFKTESNQGNFKGDFADLAKAVVDLSQDNSEITYNRAFIGSSFIMDDYEEFDVEPPLMEIEVIWPADTLQRHGGKSWAKTINGNSVSFNLKYGEFEMLFNGDINKSAQKAQHKYFQQKDKLDILKCDVLKAPHHGSDDIWLDMYDDSTYLPVVTVASMGEGGFSPTGHKHPRPDAIRKLGGFHRFFSTYIHEKTFNWNKMSESTYKGMLEKTRNDILIETDGNWFRVVEVKRNADPNFPPQVEETRRGHGTLWINAKQGD
jgi:hypothetical protein